MFLLAAVSSVLQFGKGGGVFGWFTDHFKATNSDETTLARIKAAAATEGDDVVVLSQLNSNLAKTKGAVIVNSAITAVTDVPALEGEVRISAITQGAFTQGVLYIGVNNAGTLEWQALTMNDGQLATFAVNQSVDGVYEYLDTHIYIWDTTSGKFLDNGTLISDSMKNTVKRQYISFGASGITDDSFAETIPVGAMVTDANVIVKTAFDVEFTTISVVDGSNTFLTGEHVNLKKAGVYPVSVYEQLTDKVIVNMTGGTVTTGAGVLEIVYVLPA